MRRFRSPVLAAAALALLVTAFGSPAAAAGKGTLTIVQGIPATRVDVCVNGVEVESGMAYGRYAIESLAAGTKSLKVTATGPGTCTGSPGYGHRSFDLTANGDLTVVLTSAKPGRVSLFDNRRPKDTIDIVPNNGGWIVVRHASDVGAMAIKASIDPWSFPWAPAQDPVWVKGDSFSQDYDIVGATHLVFATRPDRGVPHASTPLYLLKSLFRYEHILVGTNVENARFVNIVRSLGVAVG
jgi:hypothetical protein